TENYKMIAMDNHPKTTPLGVFWSLCIEEHFYILWMLMFFLLPIKRIPIFLVSTIAIALISRSIEPFITHNSKIFSDDILTTVDNFAIGGLPAYFLAKDPDHIFRMINKIPLAIKRMYLCFAILAVIFQQYVFPVTDNVIFNIIRPLLIAILFAGVVCIFIPVDSKIRIGERSIFTRLGKISYGLYVFHLIIIHIALKYCMDNGIKMDAPLQIGLFMTITFTASVLISSISYKYFEKRFMRFRRKS
ncbi:MAG: acyltransferase family protein, partial [Chitinophagales bacterium]